MFHIAEEEITKIRENSDIVEIISSYIPLTEKGKNFFGVCPFHEDHSPSMSVSKEKQMYKCFSCGAAGNVFKFVSDYENISFAESVKRVAEKIGITITSTVSIKKDNPHEKQYKIMSLTKSFYQNNLNTENGIPAMKYLKERSIDNEIIETFEIGYSFDSNTLSKFLFQKKYTENEIEALGLIKNYKGTIYDVFINRIMFPIHNLEGDVVGFTGRMFGEENQPKYLNSKETILFKKGQILFNYHRAKDSIRLNKKAVIVEGNMDAIRMFSSGITNVLALMGTSLTSFQINILKKLRVPLILMLDNDDAGALATYNIGILLEKEKIPIQVVRLSGEKDPDDYIKKNGIEALEDNIKNAISFLEYKLKYLKKNKNMEDTKDVIDYVKEILSGIKDSSDELEKEITLQKLSQEYQLSMNLLKSELTKMTNQDPPKIEENIIELETRKSTKLENCIHHILYFMMNDQVYIKMYKAKLGFLENKTYRGIVNEIMGFYEIHKKINIADFISQIEISPLKKEITGLIASIKDDAMDETIMEEYINTVKKIMKKNQIKKLMMEQHQELDSNKKVEIGLKIQTLKKEV